MHPVELQTALLRLRYTGWAQAEEAVRGLADALRYAEPTSRSLRQWQTLGQVMIGRGDRRSLLTAQLISMASESRGLRSASGSSSAVWTAPHGT
jgi:hypothetical protein